MYYHLVLEMYKTLNKLAKFYFPYMIDIWNTEVKPRWMKVSDKKIRFFLTVDMFFYRFQKNPLDRSRISK